MTGYCMFMSEGIQNSILEDTEETGEKKDKFFKDIIKELN